MGIGKNDGEEIGVLTEKCRDRMAELPVQTFVPARYTRKDLQFRSSFDVIEDEEEKNLLGHALKISLKDIEGEEKMGVIVVNALPDTIRCPSGYHFFSKDSLLGRNVVSLQSGQRKKFTNIEGRPCVVRILAIEASPIDIKNKFFKYL